MHSTELRSPFVQSDRTCLSVRHVRCIYAEGAAAFPHRRRLRLERRPKLHTRSRAGVCSEEPPAIDRTVCCADSHRLGNTTLQQRRHGWPVVPQLYRRGTILRVLLLAKRILGSTVGVVDYSAHVNATPVRVAVN